MFLLPYVMLNIVCGMLHVSKFFNLNVESDICIYRYSQTLCLNTMLGPPPKNRKEEDGIPLMLAKVLSNASII